MRYNFIFKNSKNTQNQTHVWDKAMYGKSIKFKKVSISERRGRHMSAVHGRSKDVGNVPFLNLVIGGGLQMLTLHCTYMLHISFGINNIFANFLKKQLSLILYRNYIYLRVSLVAQTVKNLPAMQETWGSICGLGRSPGGGHVNPLQYSSLENPHGQRSLVGSCSKELDMNE